MLRLIQRPRVRQDERLSGAVTDRQRGHAGAEADVDEVHQQEPLEYGPELVDPDSRQDVADIRGQGANRPPGVTNVRHASQSSQSLARGLAEIRQG